MATLEEKFFKTFGIKGETRHREICDIDDCGIEVPQMRFRCPKCEHNKTESYTIYPPIHSDTLLELICIANTHATLFQSSNIDDLEVEILTYFINLHESFTQDEIGQATQKDLEQQIKGLFEEE